MKYIKLFEELSASTYKKASDKLYKKGHYDRAYNLSKYANELDNKTKLIKDQLLSSPIIEIGSDKGVLFVSKRKYNSKKYINITIYKQDVLKDDRFKNLSNDEDLDFLENYIIYDSAYNLSANNDNLQLSISRKDALKIKKIIKNELNIDIPVNDIYSDAYITINRDNYIKLESDYFYSIDDDLLNNLSEQELNIINNKLGYYILKYKKITLEIPPHPLLFTLNKKYKRCISFIKDTDDYYYAIMSTVNKYDGELEPNIDTVYKIDQFDNLLKFIDDIK